MPTPSKESGRVNFTNLDKVLWPDDGITKQELIDYYRAVSGLVIEELRGRLLTLVRAPDGVGGETFFQKNASKYTPDWIKTVTVPAPSAKRDVRFLVATPSTPFCGSGTKQASSCIPASTGNRNRAARICWSSTWIRRKVVSTWLSKARAPNP